MNLKKFAGEPARLDALCDGVFSIVLTLLVIEFKVPEIESSLTVNSNMVLEELAHFIPLFYSYLISFFVIASYWTLHHKISSAFNSCDSVTVKKTFNFLLGISVLPFTTHLQGRYGDTAVGFSIYALNVALCGFALLNLWSYGKKEHCKDIPNALGKSFEYKLLLTSLVFSISVPLSFLNMELAKFSWLLLFFVAPIIKYLGKVD